MSKISNMLNMIQILKDKKVHNIQSLSENLEAFYRFLIKANKNFEKFIKKY